ncbi:acyltransferase domain-containing protein [Streptomyces sp. NPDC058657]|uniref:acyltransferase domain-containing protein n=1 Tax=unclassified Streptomyces TaxID=2593676 RepID=UPI003649DBF9
MTTSPRSPRTPVPADRTVLHAFPGQGDFAVSALVRAARAHAAVGEALSEVCEEVDPVGAEFGIGPLGPALLGSTPPSGRDLARAAVGTSQLALFVSSMAVHRALCAVGLVPDRVLGMSFGDIAACTAAGTFTLAGGARIACQAGLVLHGRQGGLTLLEAGADAARHLIAAAGASHVVLACVNDPSQVVLSGPLRELEPVEELAGRRGLPAVRLRLPFLCHHPSLAPVAEAFAEAVRHVPARAPRVPVYSSVLGRAYSSQDDIHWALAQGLVRPALLPDALRQAATPSPVLLLEAGTGSSLTHSARRVLPPHLADARATMAEADFPWLRPGSLTRLVPAPVEPPSAEVSCDVRP